MNEHQANSFLLLMGALVFTLGYSFHALQLDLDPEIYKLEPTVHNGISYRSNSGSGSMTPLLYPDTITKNKKVVNGGPILCGHIYIYNKTGENKTNYVIHRFVYESNNGSVYMKGDNNQYMDEPISRNQIIEELISIDYLGVKK